MAEKPQITLLKSGNRLVVAPTPTQVREVLETKLSFTAKHMLYGAERFEEGNKGKRLELIDYQCYFLDHKNRIATSLGFYHRITKALKARGYPVRIKDLTPPAKPEIFVPRWNRVLGPDSGIKLRHGQKEFLEWFVAQVQAGLPGRADAPPGYGKSFLIGLAAMLFPKAKIHYTSKRASVMRDRIFPELCGMLPDVGLVGGGVRKAGCRVQGYTFDSLHHSDGKCDILFTDECHEAAADDAAEQLAKYDESLNYGFSATQDMRIDNKDLRVEAMFGPVGYKMTYQTAVKHGLVVPLEVRWRNVRMDMDPCEGIEDSVERKRWGIWRNRHRNQLIAKDARSHPDQQVLVTCETIEHALALKREMPEFTLVYAARDISFEKRRYFRKLGLWPKKGLKQMTEERKQKLTRLFERGKLRKVIVTTVWNVGVSMNHLEVLVRADAGGSPIMDTQIPGRVSRTNKAIGKKQGVIYDYKDQFNSGFKRKSGSRRSSYVGNGWTQVDPGTKPGEKLQHRLWED